ncbi:hypothetical protein TNCV_4685661, partial [Trichonephila clavipes]
IMLPPLAWTVPAMVAGWFLSEVSRFIRQCPSVRCGAARKAQIHLKTAFTLSPENSVVRPAAALWRANSSLRRH